VVAGRVKTNNIAKGKKKEKQIATFLD